MGIQLGSNFTVNTSLPLDDRFVVADLVARDAILAGRRFEGMIVYVTAEQKIYQLVAGTANTNWIDRTVPETGSAGVIAVDTFTGDGATTIYTLSRSPGHIHNTWVFLDGIYQFKSAYTLSGLTLTFSEAIPLGWGIQVVIGGTVPLGVADDTQVTLTSLNNKSLYNAIVDGDIATGDDSIINALIFG